MNTIVEHINSLGHAFVEFALPMLIQSSVLIVILLLLDLLLREKVKAVFRYWIWMLVLFKLILPTSLSSPLSLGYLFGEKLTYQDLAQTSTTQEPAVPAPTEISSGVGSIYIQPNPYVPPKEPVVSVVEPVIAEPVGPPEVPVTPLSWQGVIFLVWLAVVTAMGLLLLQRALFVRGLVAQAKKAGHLMNDALSYCCASMGIKSKVGLKISVNATTPSVCGLIRPVILVPWKLTSTLGVSRLRTILMHELAHIKRGDLWVNLAQTALQIIYFYNPLLWLANFVIRRIREQAVDEAVLVAMGEKAQKYPQTLVDVAKMAFKRPALGLRLIGVVESKSALAGRIKHILGRPMPKTARIGIVGVLAVIIAGAILLPMARAQRQPEPETSVEADPLDHFVGKYAMAKHPDTAFFEITKEGDVFTFRDLGGPKFEIGFLIKSLEGREFEMEKGRDNLRFGNNPRQRYSVRYNAAEGRYILDGLGMRGRVKDGFSHPLTDLVKISAEKPGDKIDVQVGPLDHFIGKYAMAKHPDTAAFEITKKGDAFIFRDLGGPKFEMDIVLRGLAGRSFEMEKGRDNLKFGEKRRDRFCVRYEADEDRYILDRLGMRGEVQDGVSFPLTDLIKISAEKPDGTFAATLPNGVTVELVGICEHPSEGKQWWRPDGTLLEDRPYEEFSSYHSMNGGKGYELVWRVGSDEDVVCEIESANQGGSAGKDVLQNERGLRPALKNGEFYGIVFFFSQTISQAPINIGVGLERNWKTIASLEGDLSKAASGINNVHLYPAIEADGRTYIDAAYRFPKGKRQAYRLVAVDTSNRQHIMQRGSETKGRGNIHCRKKIDLPLKRIKTIHFQIQPLQWITFENVSLHPGHKTNMQVKIEEPEPILTDEIVTAKVGSDVPVVSLDHFVGKYAVAGHPDTAAFEITKKGDVFIFRDLGGPKFEMELVLKGLAGRSFEMEKGRDNLKFGDSRRDRFCVRYNAAEDRYILDGLGMRGEVQDGVIYPLTDLVKISGEKPDDDVPVWIKETILPEQLMMLLMVINSCAPETDLNIESVSITARNIEIKGDTSGRANTLKFFDAINKSELEVLQFSCVVRDNRDKFRIAVEPKKNLQQWLHSLRQNKPNIQNVEENISPKLVMLLVAIKSVAAEMDLNIESISVSAKSMSIEGDTSGITNTLKFLDAIKDSGLEVSRLNYVTRNDRNKFTFVAEPKENWRQWWQKHKTDIKADVPAKEEVASKLPHLERLLAKPPIVAYDVKLNFADPTARDGSFHSEQSVAFSLSFHNIEIGPAEKFTLGHLLIGQTTWPVHLEENGIAIHEGVTGQEIKSLKWPAGEPRFDKVIKIPVKYGNKEYSCPVHIELDRRDKEVPIGSYWFCAYLSGRLPWGAGGSRFEIVNLDQQMEFRLTGDGGDPRDAVLGIDINGDGRIDPAKEGGEQFDLYEPFIIGSKTYQLAEVDPYLPRVVFRELDARLLPDPLAKADVSVEVEGTGEENQVVWGKPSQGVQVGITVEKEKWRIGGDVPRVNVEVRISDPKKFQESGLTEKEIAHDSSAFAVEIDGKQYKQQHVFYTTRRVPLRSPFKIVLFLDDEWLGGHSGEEWLTPGRHKIRILFVGLGMRLPSGPVEIEVLPDNRKLEPWPYPWGKAVGGVQVSAHPAQPSWPVGSEPVIRVCMRNQSSLKWWIHEAPSSFALEVDGKRYENNFIFHVWRRPFTPGDVHQFDLKLSKSKPFHDGLRKGNVWPPVGKPPPLLPGKHTIRVLFTEWRIKPEPTSLPVEFEIVPAGSDVHVEDKREKDTSARGRIEFLGLDLTDAPHTTKSADLPDLFEERPPGSKSYEIAGGVTVMYGGFDGTVYHIPEKEVFYIQHDKLGSSTLTYYGPFDGDPKQVLDRKIDVPVEAEKAGASSGEGVPASNEDGPRITFENLVCDLGQIPQNTKHVCEFKYTNTGNKVLKITRVGAACACTVPQKTRECAPGESGTLKVTYQSGSSEGKVKKYVYVHSNDKVNPRVQLTIKAEIVVKVKHEPKRLNLVLDKEDAGCPAVTLTSLDDQPFSITGFESTGDSITADFDSSVKRTSFVIRPNVDMEKLRKGMRGQITINLNHPECKTLKIVFETLPEFTFDPRLVYVREAEPQKPITKTVRILSNYNEDFEIESTSSRKGTIKVLAQEKIRDGYQFELQITPPEQESKRRIFTDGFTVRLKGGQVLNITCYGIYSRKPAEAAGESVPKSDVHLEVAQSGGDSVYGSGDIVVVSEGKSKVYGSIQEAIVAAPAGSVVRIGPGVYKERLEIDKPLTLEGAGWDKTTIVTENNTADAFEEAISTFRKRILEATSEEHAKKLSAELQAQFEVEMKEKMAAQTHLVSDTGNIVIRNLKLTSPGRNIDGRALSVPVIKFSNAGALVSGCAVVGTPGNGINIEEGSDVQIRDSLVAGVWSTGIAVVSGRGDIAKASIINCDVRNCYHRGITIGPGCDSTVVEGCRISGSSWHGIRYDNASPTIVGNLIFANVRSGIYASGQTAADVRQNLFYGNEITGISCWFKNQDTIEANTFVGNRESGLQVLGASRPIMRKNIFYSNPTGVFCGNIGNDSPSAASDGTVNLEENLFWGFEYKVAWRHAGDTKDEVVTEELELDEKASNMIFDPEFKDITAEDYSLKLDSPARRSGMGAADLIDSKSPWPLQDEEIPIIPEGDTEDTSWMGRISSTGKIARPVILVANQVGKKAQESIKGKPGKQEGSDHPGKISGVVVNSDTGDPIVGAYVGVGDFGDSGGSNYSRHRSEGFHDKTKTDAEGRFELNGLVFTDEHRYLKYHPLVVTHPDFVRHEEKIELLSSGPVPDVKVSLRPAAKIEVTIVDADGNPLPGQWLIRLEALDGRRFIPPGSDPHLSSFASSIWAHWPDMRTQMGISNGFTFTGLDTGEYTIEALKFQLVDKPTPQSIWEPTITYHGSIPSIRVQAGQSKQVKLAPQDHQTRLTITHPEYPDKLMDKLERSSQMPLMCLISRSPGALLWDDGRMRHIEDQRLGRIDKKRFFRGFFTQGKPLTINNLPPDSYSLFTMAVYGQVAGYLIGARADLAKGDDITLDIPWRQPTGPSMFGPNRSFDYPVNLESKDYRLSELCEILTEITQSNPRIIADPSIENEKLSFGKSGMSVWDVLEKLYLDNGWRVDEGQDKTLIIKPAEQTNMPVEVKEHEVGSVSVIRAFDNKATLTNGLTVELLGLTEIPIKDNPWWKPDSSLLEQPPFDNISFDPSRETNHDQFAYYAVAMRLKGKAPGEIGLIKWDLLDAFYAGTMSAYLEDKRVYSRGIFGGASKFPKDVETTTLRLGLAAGDWQTLVKGSHYGVYREGEDSIIVRTPERAGGPLGVRPGEKGLHIGVTYNVTDRDFRVVAVDKDGKVHVSARSGSSGTDNLRQTTASFPDLTHEKLREFRFQTRPYEWIEFRDISLRPGKEVVALAEKRREETKEKLEKWLGRGQTRQIREQILVLRHCHIFKEMETWASAIRELVSIGRPAVPELLAEMRRTRRWPAQSTAAFTLRAIGDPASVQALIEILGQVTYRGEYGIHLKDPQLSVFMLENQHRPARDSSRKLKDPQITIGCPVIEITAALEKITGHTEGHEHYGHKATAELGRGAPHDKWQQRVQEIVRDVASRWQKWWERNKTDVPIEESLGEARVVHFPAERSLGKLCVQRETIGAPVHWWWGLHNQWQYLRSPWQYLAEARGDVTVPAGKRLGLIVGRDGLKAMAHLAKLRPDDLYMLKIKCGKNTVDKPGDDFVSYLARLTGLKELILEYPGITNKGLRSIQRLSSLERLSLISAQLDDTGMAHIAELESLKGLRFSSRNVTNAGLSHLSKLALLEELFPSGIIDDKGLAHLTKLPALRYLFLATGDFTENGLAHLKGIPSLRKLEVGRIEFSSEGLAHISRIPGLEDLSISHTVLSDEDLVPLKSMNSLKRLSLSPAFQQMAPDFTDEALFHLSQVKSLESLVLGYGKFTDKGLEYLTELRNLKRLDIPNNSGFTDDGLSHLTKLPSLEELKLRANQFTDVGMSSIARLTNLKRLELWGHRADITNKGLVRLADMSKLSSLVIKGNFDDEGLAHVGNLNQLSYLDISGDFTDEGLHHLEGLKLLKQLKISSPSKLSPQALQDLRSKLPNLLVLS